MGEECSRDAAERDALKLLFNMQSKKNRNSTKALEQIFKSGKFLNSNNLTFKFLKSEGQHVSFVAPKAIAKTAAKRNTLRRRGYAALRKHWADLPSGIAGVFVFKKELNFNDLENEIQNILHKINWLLPKIYRAAFKAELCFLPLLFGIHQGSN